MNWSRARLKEMARIALHGSYWKSVLVSLILALTSGAVGSGLQNVFQTDNLSEFNLRRFLGSEFFGVSTVAILMVVGMVLMVFGLIAIALDIFLFGPLEVGCKNFFRQNLYRPVELNTMKVGFTPNYWNVVKTQFLRGLFTTLWGLLFVIPGIVKSYEYMMMPYIQAEHPELSTEEIFARSRQMMDGEKWEAFVLDLSFIGWELLSTITLGIVGLFYVRPYVDLTHAALYGALKQKMEFAEQNYDPYRQF